MKKRKNTAKKKTSRYFSDTNLVEYGINVTLQVTEGKYQHVNVSVISGQLLVDFDTKIWNLR